MPAGPAENLAELWQYIQSRYEARGIKLADRYGCMKLTMISTKTGPKLKGKAAEVKHLAHPLHDAWKAYSNPHLEIHQKIEMALRLGCHLDDILDEHSDEFVLPGEVIFQRSARYLRDMLERV